MRIKWYHSYVLLATLDVLVLSAGILVQHRTLGSFGDLLERTAVLDSQQRDLTSLALRLIALNAPGNDVFESRQVENERLRYQRLLASLHVLRQSGHIEPWRLVSFWQEVEDMCAAEETIFKLIAESQTTANSAEAARLNGEAGRMMSVMDKHQAQAIKLISREQAKNMNEMAEVLWTHQEVLQKHRRYEYYFVAFIFLALCGMFWFLWRLQKTDEVLTAERLRLEVERRDRLAAIGELCSSVAHGIQNPLASIRSSAELIVDMGQLDEPSKVRAQNVIVECVRLSRRIARLLQFSRSRETSRRAIDVVAAIHNASAEVAPRFSQKGIRIDVNADAERMAVWADEDELATVFIELLANAFDHSPSNDVIQVQCRSRDDQIVIDVVDHGPGVSSSSADKVFDLFFTTKEDGTGIGLASVKRIVESLNGRIEVATCAEPGAVFRLTLPTVQFDHSVSKNTPLVGAQSVGSV